MIASAVSVSSSNQTSNFRIPSASQIENFDIASNDFSFDELAELTAMRRAQAIRSGWSLTERIRRRREADRRFSDLVEALSVPHEAA